MTKFVIGAICLCFMCQVSAFAEEGGECPNARCDATCMDINADEAVTARDALAVLRTAVALPVPAQFDCTFDAPECKLPPGLEE